MSRAILVAFSALLAMTGIVGDGSRIEARPTPVPLLLPVSLPDLSMASPSVRTQLRDSYTSFTVRIGDATTTAAQRADAYGEIGKLLMAAEFRNMAEPALLDAQALAPFDARWPYYLAHLYKLDGDPVRTTASFERALQLKPDDVATLVWLGIEDLEQDRPDGAEGRFARALQLEPRLAAAMEGLGRVALAKRNYTLAVERLEQALSMDRRASRVHYHLAMAYRGAGQLEQADTHVRQRGNVETGPPDPLMQELNGLLESAMAYQSRGIKALERGQAADAATFFERGLELEPGNASLHQRLGAALYVTGDVRRAVEHFEEALRLSPRFARAHYSLGVALASRGDYQAAKERFETAIKYEPDYLEARRALATFR